MNARALTPAEVDAITAGNLTLDDVKNLIHTTRSLREEVIRRDHTLNLALTMMSAHFGDSEDGADDVREVFASMSATGDDSCPDPYWNNGSEPSRAMPGDPPITLEEICTDLNVVMQAAWIEWQHGGGAELAMTWIHNTLLGPGLIPEDDAPYSKEAQAWFDANRSHPFPACYCFR
ncbi:MAG: hypothetical protein Q8R97_01265, partial [Brevundimonas sp.]|nr:hypothetical protein [Brevundimonas sp.]